MSDITISLIVAMDRQSSIGKDNAMLWHIPADFKYFKSMTMGKPMVMGRKTFESLPGVLPGRAHIVVSRLKQAEKADGLLRGTSYEHEDVCIESDLGDALDLAKSMAEGDEVFIVGGAQIYTLALDTGVVDRMYITQVEASYDADAFFPSYDQAKWREVSRQSHDGDPAFSFIVLEKAVSETI